MIQSNPTKTLANPAKTLATHLIKMLANPAKMLAVLVLGVVVISTPARADDKVVHFNAWGGSGAINDYIQWVAERVKERHGITLRHVKLNDTASAVSRILAEKTAGRDSDGSVDLIWVNGENFASMKRNGLLQNESWAFNLTNFRYTSIDELPGIINDFATPTDGLESPWGRAQLVFGYDTADLANPPRSAKALKDWAVANPGRFTFPQPPDFVGTTFLKQVLYELTPDAGVLQQPADTVDHAATLAPLWDWLDAVTPALWRGGKHYPANYTEMVQLLGDREISIAMAFNPAEFSNNISSGVLPPSVRSYIHEGGTISNVHFVAIPFNSGSVGAARLVADFLLSPEAQARKANPEIWGDPTVLSMGRLGAADRAVFEGLPLGVATLTTAGLSPGLPEPHPSWIPLVEKGWIERYGSGG